MLWIFAIASLVFGGYLLMSSFVGWGILLLVAGVLLTLRCIIGATLKLIWKIIRKPLAIVLAIVLILMALT